MDTADIFTGTDDLAEIETLIDAGTPHAVVGRLCGRIAASPADDAAFHLAFKALSVATTEGNPAQSGVQGSLDADADWPSLFRLMLLQEPQDRARRVLHWSLASLLTSNNRDSAARIVAALAPMLRQILAEDGARPGLVLFLLIARSVLPQGVMAADDLQRLHLAAFEGFSADDLALPYSVMFNADAFGANRDDLLQRYTSPRAVLSPEAAVPLPQILLLDRLGAGPLFGPGTDSGGLSLAAVLEARLDAAKTDAMAERDGLAAARVLFLRYGAAATDRAADLMSRLDLPADILSAGNALARGRAQGAALPSPLDGRTQKVLRGLVNGALMSAPALVRAGAKPRVALCVSGQLRGFRRAWRTWQRSLLPFADFDIYIHTWRDVGRASPHPFRAFLPFEGKRFCSEWRRIGTLLEFEGMQARYPALFKALGHTEGVDADSLKALFGARQVVVDDDKSAAFAGFSNQQKMHYKIAAAHDLSVQSGEPYDLVMRLRPDLELQLPGFSWAQLWRNCRTAPVIYTDSAYGVHYGKLMIGDQIALGAPDTMDVYARTFETYPTVAAHGLDGFPPELTGHTSLAQICWLAGIDVQHLPFKRGDLLEAEILPRDRILAAVRTDCAARGEDVHDRALIAACLADGAAP